jgi:hypothetical protein
MTMPDGEITPENVQERLNDYITAYKQEFENKVSSDPENIEEYSREFHRKNAHMYLAQVAWLANNAESESVRLAACKFGLESARQEENDSGDPIKNLLKDLQDKKAKVVN